MRIHKYLFLKVFMMIFGIRVSMLMKVLAKIREIREKFFWGGLRPGLPSTGVPHPEAPPLGSIRGVPSAPDGNYSQIGSELLSFSGYQP